MPDKCWKCWKVLERSEGLATLGFTDPFCLGLWPPIGVQATGIATQSAVSAIRFSPDISTADYINTGYLGLAGAFAN